MAALAGLGVLARAVARRDTAPADRELLEQLAVPRSHPARQAAEAASPAGKWWVYVPAASVCAGFTVASGIAGRRRLAAAIAGGGAIVASAVAAALLNETLDEVFPQPPAPPGRRPGHPVFPSGHALGTTTVAIAAGYVLLREGLAPAWVVGPLACSLPLASALGRLIEEKHWPSDVAGGQLAAIALATASLAVYEGLRG